MTVLLLGLSIILSGVRNILSKHISQIKFGSKQFFLTQSRIFLCGSLVLAFMTYITGSAAEKPSTLTLFYSAIYGILLLSAQYCYTAALRKGNIGVCSIVYSLGFIFPTLSGALFWNEKLTILNLIGIFMLFPIIVISGKPKSNGKKGSGTYIIPLICAMISSGGLGIMQKIQQNSPYPEQKNLFVISAFALSGIISLLLSFFSKTEHQKIGRRLILAGGGIGIAFGLCNLLNTILAGRLDSAVFFPVLNIGTILFSIVSGIVFFKEKVSENDLCVTVMGIVSILLITLF